MLIFKLNNIKYNYSADPIYIFYFTQTFVMLKEQTISFNSTVHRKLRYKTE